MASPIKNVLLIGATGNVGPHVLSAFLQSGHFNVTVLSRASSTKAVPENAKVIKSDFTPASLEAAFKGQDAVISMVAGSALNSQKAFIDAAVAAGVKRFIPSEFGSDTSSATVLERIPIFAGKAAIIDYAKTKQGSGLSWTGVITGPFLDMGLSTGFLCFNAAKKTAKIWDGGAAPFDTTTRSTVGEALVSLLSKPALLEQSANKYIFVSSFTTSQNELLTAFEKLTGARWTVEHVDAKAIQTDALAKLAKHDYSVVGPLIQAGIFSKENLGDLRAAGLWNEKLGLPKEDLEEEVKKVL